VGGIIESKNNSRKVSDLLVIQFQSQKRRKTRLLSLSFLPKTKKQSMAFIYLPKYIAPTMKKRIENFKRFEYEVRES